MKIALCQYNMIKGDVGSNIESIELQLGIAAEAGVDLFILPEFWAIGWDLTNLDKYADAPGTGIFAWMAEKSRSLEIGIMGSHPCISNGSIKNRAVLFGTDGNLLAFYDKMHLFDLMNEDEFVQPGKTCTIVDTPWGKIGMAICFDLRFPELFRQLTLEGAQLIIVPAYWPAPRLHHWRLLLQARAVENQLFIAGVNRSRGSGGLSFGYSSIIAPDGEILVEAGESDVLLITEINIESVKKYRQEFPALSNRKHGHYGLF
ncbi:carbon-nitrogen family hydrolase [bacterium]|nr:carbon-nitrogen family hydrolase [bacterium]